MAVNLLERFGDKQQNRLLPSLATRTPLNRSTTSSLTRTPQAAAPQPQLQQQRMLTPYTGVYRNMNNNNLNSTLVATNLQVTSATPTVRAGQELRRRTPFPVIDESSRSALDRIVDFIVGDGPQNRVGMICKQCHRHNGIIETTKLNIYIDIELIICCCRHAAHGGVRVHNISLCFLWHIEPGAQRTTRRAASIAASSSAARHAAVNISTTQRQLGHWFIRRWGWRIRLDSIIPPYKICKCHCSLFFSPIVRW